MNEFEKAEFWEALNRLYTSSLAVKDATEHLAVVAQEQARMIAKHEDRLDRSEILIEVLLEDMKRYRLSVGKVDEAARQALAQSEATEKRLEEMIEKWRRRREDNN